MLHVIATPIGNLGDLSPRALETLKSVSIIACEDTRRTWRLLSHFGIPRPAEMFSYRQGNEERVTGKVMACLAAGKEVALCSDGGYPGISDPGYRLIRTCAQEAVDYEVIPGACAVEVALLKSGLPTSSYTFRGFPPRGPGALRNWFEEDRAKEHTLVCYESPFRVAATLGAALEALGDREAAVCIELTKLHERVRRGYLSDLVKEFKDVKVKGEVALVIAGGNPKFRRGGGDESVGGSGLIETIARGVCIVGDKILLCRAKGSKTTYLPGGHIEFGETGRTALIREIQEEMGVASTAGKFLGVVENSFLQHGRRHCEINLVYELTLADHTVIESQEDWIGFEWCPLDRIHTAHLLPANILSETIGGTNHA
ncbi:MAG: 16S rRNA (cytidine(1402)-2'-O)-methyltransferase [Kiritimatiellae bacterium]|nr:16S rRNA (cytidine(1402)-2'-O)-methyltransferase [Kiritimatiellia bacterium]